MLRLSNKRLLNEGLESEPVLKPFFVLSVTSCFLEPLLCSLINYEQILNILPQWCHLRSSLPTSVSQITSLPNIKRAEEREAKNKTDKDFFNNKH